MSNELRKMSAEEFARRIKMATDEADKRYAFFLGAGCSVTSGIPTAGALVRERWLPKLCRVRAPKGADVEEWARKTFPEYDPQTPSAFYGNVMKELFIHPEERQHEIERLCDGRFPGFGYATLSSLVAIDGGCFNVVLTTNFDDLMPDALYLFTKARPLVINHESLANYIRPTRTRPLVVKLHGDNRLSPQNISQETDVLKKDIETPVQTILHDRGLIFMGYGGNDKGIVKMLNSLPGNALPFGIYWISSTEPTGEILPWLESRQAVWVEKGDFDELMLLVKNEFELPPPTSKRFDEVFEKYRKTYEKLSGRIVSLPDTDEHTKALKEAIERTDKSFSDWWAVEVAASRLEKTNPDEADKIYQDGLKQFPNSSALLGNYANFLYKIRKNYDVAEEYYRRALESDPTDATDLSNYALFLESIRKDYDGAEEHYHRALEADPTDANALGSYADFLHSIRKDYDVAEEHYRRALEADPNDVNTLGNYAGFLFAQGKNEDGFRFLNEALGGITSDSTPGLASELWFYAFAHRPLEGRDEALKNLKKALLDGDISSGWDLSQNIARAREGGHPDVEWLEKLAAVITGDTDISTLDAWGKWKMA